LDERGKERSGKAKHETHEPEDVDADVRKVGSKLGKRWWWSGWDGHLRGDGGDLGRDLSE